MVVAIPLSSLGHSKDIEGSGTNYCVQRCEPPEATLEIGAMGISLTDNSRETPEFFWQLC